MCFPSQHSRCFLPKAHPSSSVPRQGVGPPLGSRRRWGRPSQSQATLPFVPVSSKTWRSQEQGPHPIPVWGHSFHLGPEKRFLKEWTQNGDRHHLTENSYCSKPRIFGCLMGASGGNPAAHPLLPTSIVCALWRSCSRSGTGVLRGPLAPPGGAVRSPRKGGGKGGGSCSSPARHARSLCHPTPAG